MSNMKTATVRDVQPQPQQDLQWVEDGEVVVITRHKRVVANLVPSTSKAAKLSWPDFGGRMKTIWGDVPRESPQAKSYRRADGTALSVYLDSSAIVKLYAPESDSASVAAYVSGLTKRCPFRICMR